MVEHAADDEIARCPVIIFISFAASVPSKRVGANAANGDKAVGDQFKQLIFLVHLLEI